MRRAASITAGVLAAAALGLAMVAAGQPQRRSPRALAVDAGVSDASWADGAVFDADVADADASIDAGVADGASPDAAPADAGDADAGQDVDVVDGAVRDGAALDGAVLDGAVDRPRPLGVSFEATAGFGWVHEETAQDEGTFGVLDISASYQRVPRLELRLDLSFMMYDRTYLTRLPAADGTAALVRAETGELRVRTMATAAWDVLPHRAIRASRAQVSPLVRIELDRFDNDVAPHTDFGIGLGVRGFWRIANALRLEAEWSWAWQPVSGSAASDGVLLLGTPRGSMIYGLGAVLLLRPRMRFGVHWQGEWLANDHSDRHSQAVLFVLGMDL